MDKGTTGISNGSKCGCRPTLPSPVTRSHKLCEAIHVAALAVWLGSLIMTGIIAARVFPMMKDIGPSLPDHAGYTGDHWLIVAGRVGDMAFTSLDMIQFGAVLIAVVTLAASIWVFGLPTRRWSTLIRALGLAVAMILVCVELFFLAPRMSSDLRAYWDAAKLGDNATAELHREAFTARHPAARNVLGGTTLAVLATLIVGAWSIGSGRGRGGSTQ